MKIFPDLLEALSLLCESEETEDPLSLNAAVLLGKLCVHDENAIKKLRQVVKDCKNTHTLSQVMICFFMDIVFYILCCYPVVKH